MQTSSHPSSNRQEALEIMENQDSTIESYTSNMPPGGRLKRGAVVDIYTGDDGDKKPAAKPAASAFKNRRTRSKPSW